MKKKNVLQMIYKFLLGFIWAAVIAVCFINRDKFSVDEVLKYTPSNSFLAAFGLLCLFALKSASIVIYCGILYAASGIMFPLPIAILVNILGTAVMISIPYYIGKKDGRQAVDRITKRFPKTDLIKNFQEQNDFIFPFLVRLAGILPCDVVSLYFGACGTDYLKYLLASISGMLPQIITFPILGTNVSNIKSPEFIIPASIDIVLMLLSIIICTIMNKRHRKKLENQ